MGTIKLLIIILIALFMSACASYRPIVDSRSIINQQEYETDLAECQAYASQVDPGTNAAVGAVGGAAVGAVLGAIVGAFFGCPGETAGFGAALFGASGGMQGAGQSMAVQRDIIRRCLIGRGYQVLN